MAANFIWEFDRLGDKDVMGIYGAAHTDPYSMDYYGRVDSMAKQLAACYGEALHATDLESSTWIFGYWRTLMKISVPSRAYYTKGKKRWCRFPNFP